MIDPTWKGRRVDPAPPDHTIMSPASGTPESQWLDAPDQSSQFPTPQPPGGPNSVAPTTPVAVRAVVIDPGTMLPTTVTINVLT